MKCEEISMLLVDDRARRSPAVVAHVVSCSKCQTVLAFDAWARQLGRLDAVPALTAPDGWRAVGRRNRGRLALVMAGVVVGGGVLGAASLGGRFVRDHAELAAEPISGMPAGRATETEPLRAAAEPSAEPSADSAQGVDESLLDELEVETASYVRRDVTVRDVTYASFGELPRWVSLPTNRALDAPVFQRALYPIQSNLEVNR